MKPKKDKGKRRFGKAEKPERVAGTKKCELCDAPEHPPTQAHVFKSAFRGSRK